MGLRRDIDRLIRFHVPLGERVLPDYIIAGSMKCGTSSLHRWLTRHPSVRAPSTKEVNFFDRRFEEGAEWYRCHFPLRSSQSRTAPWITGEASPGYIFDADAPGRARELLPDAKVLMIFREPVSRTFSHYKHWTRVGKEHRSIEEALEEQWDATDAMHRDLHRGGSAYLALSDYAPQVERWLHAFDRDRVLILHSADLFADPTAVLRRAEAFLGLDPFDWSAIGEDLAPHNVGGYSDKLDPAVRDRLVQYFAPRNEALFSLIGEDFGWNSP